MPIEYSQLLIFIPAALALNLTPGNDMLFSLGQGLKSGPRAGIAASFGIATGAFIHSLLAAFGLAALLKAYPLAFEIIRWAGVAYLLWLAMQTIRHPAVISATEEHHRRSTFLAWRDGVVVNVLNPKVAIFILAFVPQFVDPTRGSTVVQFLIFGAILNIGGTIINGLVGAYAGQLGSILANRGSIARAFQCVSALVFVGLAARIAFDRR